MLVIGLTGGMGAGKSTVADIFAQLGVEIIDADKIAREITKPDTPAYQAIVKHFGSDILLEDKTLNRKALRHHLTIPTERDWLQKLLHPAIIKIIEEKIHQTTSFYCIAVIPLLLEINKLPFIDRILVIDAPEEIQIERVAKRDNVEIGQIKAIINTQIARSERLARAHDVIVNDGHLDHLTEQVKKLHEQYLRLT